MGDAGTFPGPVEAVRGSDFEIVVAHYNEHLGWIESMASQATIYVKGNLPSDPWIFRDIARLPNIGRESHTFLHHIVSRYDTLATITLFTQGAVDGKACHRAHTKMTITEMSTKALEELGYDNSGSSSIPGLGVTIFGSEAEGTYRSFDQWDGFDWETDPDNVLWLSQQKPGRFLKADCTPAELWREIFGYEHPKSIMFAEGAFFAANAETIRRRPRHFYKKILDRFVALNHVNPEIGHFVEKFRGEMFRGNT